MPKLCSRLAPPAHNVIIFVQYGRKSGTKKGPRRKYIHHRNDGLGDWYPGHRKEKMIGHAGGGCENVQQAEELTRSKLDEHVKHEAHTAGAEDLPKKKRNRKIARGCLPDA